VLFDHRGSRYLTIYTCVALSAGGISDAVWPVPFLEIYVTWGAQGGISCGVIPCSAVFI
jgi:hypothetical protein